MPLFIQAPQEMPQHAEEFLIGVGFRWCTKDKRWECKKKLHPEHDKELRLKGFCAHEYGKKAARA